jgi:hypothetical protein
MDGGNHQYESCAVDGCDPERAAVRTPGRGRPAAEFHESSKAIFGLGCFPV